MKSNKHEFPQLPEETIISEPEEEKAFSPAGELQKIKELPSATKEERQERRKQLGEYKEKLVEQKLGIAKMQEEFESVIRKIADLKPEDQKIILDAMLEQKSKEYQLDPYQKAVTEVVINTYERKHKNIEKNRKTYPKDTDFFKALFGHEPKGKIEIIESPIMVYIRCYNPDDFALIDTGAFDENDNPNEAEKAAARLGGGSGITTGCLIPSLSGVVAAENASNLKPDEPVPKEIFIHEEQHIIKLLFSEAKLRSLDSSPKADLKEFTPAFENSLRELREDAERKAKDEILAYYKDGLPLADSIPTLLNPKDQGGDYDFLRREIKYYKNPEIGAAAKNIAKKVYETEYKEILDNGINAISQLRQSGYSRDRIVALLIKEPLSRWPKLVGRIKEQKNA